MLTYENWQEDLKPTFDSDDQHHGALEVLEWAYNHYQEEIIYACSFGVEGLVLIDLIAQVNPEALVIFLDTGLHFDQTYELIEKVKDRYPKLNIVKQKPVLTIHEQAETYGNELWKRDPNTCCELRKIIPLNEVLKQKKAWISGLRREQSITRRNIEFINRDHRFRSIKICPLIHWTWEEIWRYVHKFQLPYNTLHDQGYPSIGCAPCTSPVFNNHDLRSGRWAGHQKVECGLHTT
jgi:phosphoadenosine phosphosulfate reductase